MNICAVIPAYNEEKTIGEVIEKTKRYIDTVIVVDNDSSDNTVEVALINNAIVVNCRKKGVGITQYTGLQYAISEGYDYILQLDADGQHNPEYIPTLIEVMKEDCDIIIGSRFLCESYRNLSFTRKIGIRFFSKVVSILGGTKITDVTSGFRLCKTSSMIKLNKPDDIHPLAGQALEALLKGMTIKEIPIEMPNRYAGESHLSIKRFALYPFRVMWIIIKVFWNEKGNREPSLHSKQRIFAKDVKEFIRLLKDVVKKQADEILQKARLSLEEWHDELPLLDKIDKLAGEGLI